MLKKIWLAAVVLAAVAWAYSPVCSGYYLMEDDLWTFIDRGEPLEVNQAFKSQALFAGRPVGALWDYFLVRKVDNLAEMNKVRAVGIVLLMGIGGLLFLQMKEVFVSKTSALLVSFGAVLLPCFQSPAIKYFEMNSLLSCLLSLLAAEIGIRFYDERHRVASLLPVSVSVVVVVVALMTYQHSALIFYSIVVFCVLRNATKGYLEVSVEKIAVLFCVPAIGMILYLLAYKAFFLQHSAQSLVVNAGDLYRRVVWFFQFPVQMGMDYWNLLTPLSYIKPYFDSMYSYVFIISCVMFVCGIALVVKRLSFMSKTSRVLTLAVLLASIASAVAPSLFSNVVGSAYRRLQPIQIIFFVVTAYFIVALLNRFMKRAVLMCVALTFLTLAWRANYVVQYKVELVSLEFMHIRSALASCFRDGSMIHYVTSPRYASSQDFVGLMTNFKPWIPGVTLVVLKDIAFSDEPTSKAVSSWTLGTANDHVTASTIEEFSAQNIYVPEGSCMVDMTPLSALVIDGMTWSEHPFGTADENSNSAHVTSSISLATSYTRLTGVVSALSGGDYPGYEARLAFDNDYVNTRWASAQVGPQVKGTAFLGVEFAREESVDGFLLRQGGAVSSISLSYSENGEDWKELDKIRVVPDSNVHLYVANKSAPAARFWRVVAAGELPYPAAWSVYELTFIKLQGGK